MQVSRIANNFCRLLFDQHYSTNVTNKLRVAMKQNKATGASKYKNLFTNVKDGFKYAEKKSLATNKSLWQSMKSSVTTLPKDMKSMWTNTAGAWGKTKGAFKVLGKRLPVIGSALMVAFELPNIFSAFKDKGLVGGGMEIGKSGARLGGFMAGMAIGQALIPIPIVGGIIGGMVGDWLVSRVVGKSHSEEKAEAEQLAMAQQEQLQAMMQQYAPQYTQALTGNSQATQTAIPQATMTPQQLAYMQQQLYGSGNFMNDDFMANATGMNRLNYIG